MTSFGCNTALRNLKDREDQKKQYEKAANRPHEHRQNMGIILANQAFRIQLFEIPLGGEVYRVVDFPLQRRKLQVLEDFLKTKVSSRRRAHLVA